MLIQIDKLKRRPRQVVIDERATDFTTLQELVNGKSVLFDENIRGTLTASWAGKIIEVKGHLSTRVTTSCGRCLVPVFSRLELDVLLCYSDSAQIDSDVAEELEIRSEELGLVPFSGTEIDLAPDIEQEIIMALPQHLLCDEGCQGLCPVCGINLNRDKCVCVPPVFHAGLAALKNFKVDK